MVNDHDNEIKLGHGKHKQFNRCVEESLKSEKSTKVCTLIVVFLWLFAYMANNLRGTEPFTKQRETGMPLYKLIYLDARGRAEISRLVFALAGEKFEDIRITYGDLDKIKPTTPFGQIPVLEVDGIPYAQSFAHINYLAREFNLHGETNLESLAVEQVLFLVKDFQDICARVFVERDATKKAELEQNLVNVEVPKYLGFFEKLLTESGTGYFVGDSLKVADLAVFDLLFNVRIYNPTALDSQTELKAHIERVEDNSRIKAYLANRKQTDF